MKTPRLHGFFIHCDAANKSSPYSLLRLPKSFNGWAFRTTWRAFLLWRHHFWCSFMNSTRFSPSLLLIYHFFVESLRRRGSLSSATTCIWELFSHSWELNLQQLSDCWESLNGCCCCWPLQRPSRAEKGCLAAAMTTCWSGCTIMCAACFLACWAYVSLCAA